MEVQPSLVRTSCLMAVLDTAQHGGGGGGGGGGGLRSHLKHLPGREKSNAEL